MSQPECRDPASRPLASPVLGRLVPGRTVSFLVCALLAFGVAGALAQGAPAEMEVLDEREGTGEQCLVCRQQIEGDMVVEVRYKGRTFHVAKKMLPTFEADPEAYFRTLQARGSLFDEEAMPPVDQSGRKQGSNAWLLFGLYSLVGVVFAAVTSYVAIGRSRQAIPWFFAGLFLNVIGLIWLLATGKGRAETNDPYGVPAGLRKVPMTPSPESCSRCGGAHHPAARVCAVCGTDLSPTMEAETARA